MPPAKAVKTERTHEENQERAYIAASRRSDRSLEARVESARRASEIHKRRTGRSLRVTEQDVVNEEMYEEEDDDLPMQYRRLTAHLQTGSADFNRRLAAYLTNHVAMRSALDQAITSSYAQHYPNGPQFAHNQPSSMFQSPLGPEHMMPNGQQNGGSIYRQSPYPTAPSPGFKQTPHARSSSIATPQEFAGARRPSNGPAAGPGDENQANRRMSMPMPSPVPGSSTAQITSPNPNQAQSQQPQQQQHQQNFKSEQPYMQMPYDMNGFQNDFSPFTTSLPHESQLMLAPALDPNDPLTSLLMQGYNYGGDNSGDSNGNNYQKPGFNNGSNNNNNSGMHPSYDGMNSTLAPSALDASGQNKIKNEESDPTSLQAMNFNMDSGNGQFKPANLSRTQSTHGSGSAGTPMYGDDWNAFIDDSWDQTAA
ncbi:MAG: hypothetical protein M4579_007331 [Chaenotheca gracillima]|nr:MAG: hypothetical protein M4579_007331 [Chaenotheca gracillima]